jgi:hypothetical protein
VSQLRPGWEASTQTVWEASIYSAPRAGWVRGVCIGNITKSLRDIYTISVPGRWEGRNSANSAFGVGSVPECYRDSAAIATDEPKLCVRMAVHVEMCHSSM